MSVAQAIGTVIGVNLARFTMAAVTTAAVVLTARLLGVAL